VSEAFKALGLRSLVIASRADVADVEVFAKDYSFVADAKAFRLSRTAKNQKDFKVSAMDTWKRGKKYAMLVCPIYQLPTRSSQIYEQATTRNVCIYTYSHLALAVQLARHTSVEEAQSLLAKSFQTVAAMNPSKDALVYWTQLNRTMFDHSPLMVELWKTEKQAASESVKIAKALALEFLATERERIMRMGHDEALQELIKGHRLDSKIQIVTGVAANNILDLK
jgi:type II restriction enzyme